MGSIKKWRKRKMAKHKYKKRLKKTQWQRKHKK
ncbi:MAG: AURKAIP1/COX24 domain-containing protein [Chloroflexota bacterium]|nr:AURKAIP1/COX24 domain-containing protein [Chloroflexota bacterium]